MFTERHYIESRVSTEDQPVPNTTDLSLDGRRDNEESMPIYIALRMVFGIVALLGNGLILHCIRKFESLQTPTNYLVAGLAVADFLTGFLPILILVTYLYRTQTYWIPLCLASETLKLMSIAANLGFIFWIALDRYIYIARPLKYRLVVTQSRVNRIIAVTWICSVSGAVVSILGFTDLHQGMSCYYEVMVDPLMYRLVSIPILLLVWLAILSCYIGIGLIAWRHTHTISRNSNCRIVPRDWRISRMMAMIPGVFFVSTLPCTAMGFIANTRGYWVPSGYRIGTLLWWTQSWANPLIYAWQNKYYRRAFKKELSMLMCHKYDDNECGF